VAVSSWLALVQCHPEYHQVQWKNLQLLFQMANDLGPSIIFMDECESILCNRAKSNSQAMTNIASTLLNLMSVHPKVSLIATTNLPWMIDPAFARRFNTRLLLDLPNKKKGRL
jgi:katanin p60 ATPase-containing subunit A1